MRPAARGSGLILAALLASPPAPASEQPAFPDEALKGEVRGTLYRDSPEEPPLFTFVRRAEALDGTIRARREYLRPDGEPAARETVTYRDGRLARFEREVLQTREHGSVRIEPEAREGRGEILFEFVDARGKRKTGREKLEGPVLVNDSLVAYMHRRWDALMGGEKLKFRFVALSRAETVGFQLSRDEEAVRDGEPVVIVRMQPTSFFIDMLVDDVFFTVERDGAHRVLQYRGRTTPRLRDGDKWKDLDALTVFHW